EKMCSSSMATCCWIVNTAGGSIPSTPRRRRSAVVNARSWFCVGSRRSCSPRVQCCLFPGFSIMRQPGRPRPTELQVLTSVCAPSAPLGYAPIANPCPFFAGQLSAQWVTPEADLEERQGSCSGEADKSCHEHEIERVEQCGPALQAGEQSLAPGPR